MRFASLFVQVLNVILLTADEASELCAQLRSCFPAGKEGGKELFDQLFPAWSLNAFSAIALCWLAENYAVAYAITQRLATQEPSLAMLLQAEKLPAPKAYELGIVDDILTGDPMKGAKAFLDLYTDYNVNSTRAIKSLVASSVDGG